MNNINTLGYKTLNILQAIGLFIIAIATVVAIGEEIRFMITNGKVTLADLLLLFIYLEVLAMVAIYLESGKLPVRMPLYIAIVALARYLILDMKDLDTLKMLTVAGSTLIIAITVLVIRYGHLKFPYEQSSKEL